ncbi:MULTISPECIES: hypothetical protein [unclassified Streptomyces]|uniref:hypothetical protein n=1 Tax=unclassified Streptomyces TaxID=2593676 RepID=UPI0033BA62B0
MTGRLTSTAWLYLGLAGARPILTNASEETYANLVTTLGADNGNGAIMCIHGGVGLGKTFAVNLHLDELAPHTTPHLTHKPHVAQDFTRAGHREGKCQHRESPVTAAL